MATAEQNKALTRRWFDEVWNQGREETIDELAAPDVTMHGLGDGGGDVRGPDGFRPFWHRFREAFPDLRITIDDLLADGDKTAARVTLIGTHRGPGIGVPPSGRPVRMSAMVIARWQGGRLVEGWNELDAAGLMRQIGAAPPAAAEV